MARTGERWMDGRRPAAPARGSGGWTATGPGDGTAATAHDITTVQAAWPCPSWCEPPGDEG